MGFETTDAIVIPCPTLSPLGNKLRGKRCIRVSTSHSEDHLVEETTSLEPEAPVTKGRDPS